MRAFISCELPAGVAAGLAVWAADATGRDPALRLMAIDQLHLTLAFLGNIGREDVGPLEDAIDDAVRDEPWPSALRLGEPIWLSPRAPHVLAVSVLDEDGALGALQSRLIAGLVSELGFTPDTRPFLAHVTVARIRSGRVPRSYALDVDPPPTAFAADGVVLMRSNLGPGGAQYETLIRVCP